MPIREPIKHKLRSSGRRHRGHFAGALGDFWSVAAALAVICLLIWPTPARSQEPVEIVKNSLGVYFRHIPAGRFQMGAGPDFSGEPQYEAPAHQVSITRAFRISAHEITREQWKKVMGTEPARQKGPLNPVVNVSWEDVQVFLQRLGQLDGASYRLPTEAEWEYAARAGTSTAFYFGSDPAMVPEYAWCAGADSKGGTAAVGLKPPNPWGLYDMYGNVSEWVADWYGESYYTAKAVANPKGPSTGTMRGVRGGSVASDAKVCQSAWRDGDLPMVRSNHIGFRIAYDD